MSDRGLLAWDVDRLLELSQNLPVRQVPLHEIRELDETFWFDRDSTGYVRRRRRAVATFGEDDGASDDSSERDVETSD